MHLDLILEPNLSPAEIAELGQLAEQFGFRGLWAQNYSSARDAFMSLIPAAQATNNLLLGVVIVCPYEMHPMKTVNSLLTLNEYAEGRAMVVIGSGGEWPEVARLGTFNENYDSRSGNVREALEIMRRAIREKEISYTGKHYSALRFSTRWHKQSPPIVYHGACGPRMLGIGADHADGIMMSDVMPAMFAKRLPVLKQALKQNPERQRFRLSNFVAWHVRTDRERSFAEARRELIVRGWLDREWLEPYLTTPEVDSIANDRWPFLNAWIQGHGDIEGVPRHVTDTLVRELSLAGNLADLDGHIERLRVFNNSGFTEIALRLHEEPADSIRLIGSRVLPALQ
jgi:alkanesulfonate monooxygenase SsuD/methylene tetrahydromethanopterin reductase-like flavin-dependent oxidoreductase (luciferase family)